MRRSGWRPIAGFGIGRRRGGCGRWGAEMSTIKIGAGIRSSGRGCVSGSAAWVAVAPPAQGGVSFRDAAQGLRTALAGVRGAPPWVGEDAHRLSPVWHSCRAGSERQPRQPPSLSQRERGEKRKERRVNDLIRTEESGK